MNKITVQAGFSLISLMIASSIGLFLIAVIGNVYVKNKASFDYRSSVAEAHENGRYAVRDLQRTLVSTGRGISALDDTPSQYQDGGVETRRTFPADNISDGSASTSSSIAFRYATGPEPCGHEGNLLNELTTVRFFIDDNQVLMCQVDTKTPTPMVPGVINMQALYGVDRSSNGSADQYLSAATVSNDGLWPNVIAIRIGFLVSSADRTIPSLYRNSVVDSYSILGTDVEAPDSKHYFTSVSTTIMLRNLHNSVQRQ